MDYESIPDDLKRFILTSIESVPHLETLLFFHRNPNGRWDARVVGLNIFVPEKKIKEILEKLHETGFLTADTGKPPLYWFSPRSEQQKELVERLAELYSKELISVTNLIHSKAEKIQQFADAFKLRKE